MEDSISVPLVLPNKAEIRVMVTELSQSGDEDVALTPIVEALRADNIQAAIEGIGQIVTGAFSKLAPAKAVAEFALEVGIESGKLTALWVKGTGKANLRITLEWHNEPKTY